MLASSSPRRRELLERVGVRVTVRVPDVDESVRPGEPPTAYVARLAAAKAAAVPAGPDDLVVGADTTVVLGAQILGKPLDVADARRMLVALSGGQHHVHTAVAMRRGSQLRTEVVTTAVRLVDLDEATIDWYVGADGGPDEILDKAGAYAIQGAGAVLVAAVHGSVTNVIGLPLDACVRLAAELGVDLLGRR